MIDVARALPEYPEELRKFTRLLLAEVKSQALLITKLKHQLAGHNHHRYGSRSEMIEQLQLALETSGIATAAMTARLRLPNDAPKDKPKRKPIPDHIPRMEVELATGDDACAECGGKLRRLGEDVTEELEYVPGRFIVNRITRPRFACSCCDPIPGELYPRLTEVNGKCPPEGVGGFPGYYEFLDAMADPKHPEHDHLKDWYGDAFDPNQPETDELKLEVLRLAKRWKPRKPRK